MKKDHPQLYCKSAEEWREWLAENWDKQKVIWLIYYKKHTGKERVAYDDAVEEALCFGWIDSTVKRIDDERYMQQFTPRNEKSNWSDLNKKRIAKLMKSGKMTAPGLKAVEVAKQNGKWYEPDRPSIPLELSPGFLQLLKERSKAYNSYHNLTSSQQRQYKNWVMSAKRAETQQKRFNEMIGLLESGQKPGMK